MIYVVTNAGRDKTESEDSVLVGEHIITDASAVFPVPMAGFVCVADGVGGNQGGKDASAYVLRELTAYFDESDIASYIMNINRKLIEEGASNSGLSRMATTLTGIHIFEESVELIHIGNSRAYALQGGYLKQLTSDHTIYNWLMSTGRTSEAAQCNRNEIIGCLGGGNPVLADKLFVSKLQKTSTVILTTDGIHDYVSIDDMETVMRSTRSGLEKCNDITASAIEAGSTDDMSIVIICNQEEQ